VKLTPRVLEGRFVRLEPLSQANREGLRRAFDAIGDETWMLMSLPGAGEHFDGWWQDAVGDKARIAHAVVRIADGEVVGTTSFLQIRPRHAAVEVGWTVYRPDVRGGVVNPECKLLMLGRAFEAGARRVEIMVDERNLRSQAAVRKLGAVQEGVLRKHKTTWTGHVRNTVAFSVLDDEWPAVRAGLEARLQSLSHGEREGPGA
jgi:RimJ/RimL family protein N-acetyltransferase